MALAQMKPNMGAVRLLEQGAACHRAGDLDGATQNYRKALRLQPDNPDGLHLLGLALWQQGSATEGVKFILKALAVRDDFPDAHSNAGLIFVKTGDYERAETHFRRALHYRPAMPAVHHTLGTLLRHKKQLAEAADAFRSALRWDPRAVDSHVELVRTLRTQGDTAALVAALTEALKVAPNHPTLRIFLAEVQFAQGQLKDGWQNYRVRFESLENPVKAKSYQLPHWEGSDLTAKSILIWTEQGPGDEIMYANMFADVIRTAKRCVIQSSPRLAPLFRRSFPSAEVVDRDLAAAELSGFDFQCSAGNLGIWLRPDVASFPNNPAYLQPDLALRDRLRAKYRSENPDRVLVGVAWRSSNAESAAEKSQSIAEWGPIFNVPGVQFVNLQYGDCAAELDAVARGFGVTVIQDSEIDPLRDIDSYAAQIAALDFVICSSNTAAHVAGALGIPTICMLPRTIGRGRRWYWFAEEGRCPWYPSVRLSVQPRDDTWLDVLRDAGLTLLDFVASHGAATPEGYLTSMATAFARTGRGEDAELLLGKLKALPGRAARALHTIGNIRKEQGDFDGAMRAFNEAAFTDASFWPAYNDMGLMLAQKGRFEDAIQAYQKGLERSATSVELLHNLGTALRQLGYSGEAVRRLEAALALNTPNAIAGRDAIELNYAGALDEEGRVENARERLRDIISRAPDNVDAHYNLAQLLLSTGDFVDGWRELEWRLRRDDANVRYEIFPSPRWRGEPLAGKKVLIWTEQGIGDEIFLASMIPDACAAAKEVVVLCSDRMVPLFRRSFPKARVELRKKPLPQAAISPDIDFQMSLADLGAAFRTSFNSFPERKRFLTVNAGLRDKLRARYEARRPGAPIVGVCWSSLKNYEIGWLKSAKLAEWAPILQTPNVTFVSLQYGDRSAELEQIRAKLGVDIIQDAEIDALTDMDAFAAQTAAMDLVISISNTTVHTAAALGVPVWVLLAEGRGRLWYWYRGRKDSPWYPTARLFRQARVGEWGPSIHAISEDLRAWVKGKAGSH